MATLAPVPPATEVSTARRTSMSARTSSVTTGESVWTWTIGTSASVFPATPAAPVRFDYYSFYKKSLQLPTLKVNINDCVENQCKGKRK